MTTLSSFVIQYYTNTWVTKTDAIFVKKREELNYYAECTISLPNTSANRDFVSTDKKIRVLFNNEVIFSGLFTCVKYTETTIEYTGYPEAYVKSKNTKFTADYSSGAPASTIANAIATYCGFNSSCPYTNTIKIKYEDTPSWDALVGLAEMLNCDIWADYDSQVVPYVYFGNKGSSITQTNIVERNEVIEDRADKIHAVKVKGIDVNGNEIEAMYPSTPSGNNIYVTYYPHPTDTTNLTTVARKKYREMSLDTISSKIYLRTDQHYNVKVGDTLTIIRPDLHLVGTFRIASIELNRITVETELARIGTKYNIIRKMYKNVDNRISTYSLRTVDIENVNDNSPSPPSFSLSVKETDTATVFETYIEVNITPVPETSGYVVEYKKGTNGTPYYISVGQSSSNIYINTPPLDASTQYYVRVASLSLLGRAFWSDYQTATTASNNTPPPTPTNFTATGIKAGVFLKWDDVGANDLLGYDVYWGTSPDMLLNIARTKNTFYRFDVTSSSQYTTLYFGVKAIDTANNASTMATTTGTPLRLNAYDTSVEMRSWTAKFRMYEDASTQGKLYWDDGSGGSPKIYIQDIGEKTINAGNGTYSAGVRYFYYVLDNATLQTTTTYSDTVGSNKFLLAIANIKTTSGEKTTIFTFNNYQPTIGTGVLASGIIESAHIKANAIDSTHLQSDIIESRHIKADAIQVGGSIGGLKAYFDIDTTITEGSTTYLVDLSANGYRGTPTATPVIEETYTKRGKAAKFDVSTANYHFIHNVPFEYTEDKTIMCWFKLTADGYDYFLSNFLIGVKGLYIYVRYSTNSIRGRFGDGVAAREVYYTLGQGDRNWHHVAVTLHYDSSIPTTTMKLYLDGTKVHEASWNTTPNSPDYPRIGYTGQTNAYVDETAFFGRVLDDEEIRSLYRAGSYRVGLIGTQINKDLIQTEAIISRHIKAGEINTDHIRFNLLTNDPTYEAGKLWYRSDLDQLRFSAGSEEDNVSIIPKYPIGYLSVPQENLLINGDFEDWCRVKVGNTFYDAPTNWIYRRIRGSQNGCIKSTTNAYKGACCTGITMTLGAEPENEQHGEILSHRIPVRGSKLYYVKANVCASTSITMDTPTIRVYWYDAAETYLTYTGAPGFSQALTTSWKTIEFFAIAPANARFCKIALVAHRTLSTGTINVYFDDVVFSRAVIDINKKTSNLLLNTDINIEQNNWYNWQQRWIYSNTNTTVSNGTRNDYLQISHVATASSFLLKHPRLGIDLTLPAGLSAQIFFSSTTNYLCWLAIGNINPSTKDVTTRHAGIVIENGILYISLADGSTQIKIRVGSYSAGTYTFIILYAPNGAHYLRDNGTSLVRLGDITLGIPISGLDALASTVSISSYSGDATAKTMRIYNIRAYSQRADR